MIRKAKLKDVATVVELEKELMDNQVELVGKYSPEHSRGLRLKKDSPKIIESFVRRMIRSKNGLVLLAEIDDYPVGYLILMIRKNIPVFQLENLGEITDIYVRPDFVGTGVSTRMKEEAFAWLKKKGIKKVTLNMFPDNKHAFNIYTKWGFSPFMQEMRADIK
jgi:GNAT superfamily N-acetyltransferase